MEPSEAAGAPRKRDRDSQFGPTTPGAEETSSLAGEQGDSVGPSHQAKKNRIISRDNSLNEAAFRSAAGTGDGDDLDLTPPGTPVVSSAGLGRSDSRTAGTEATPPGTPVLHGRPLAGKTGAGAGTGTRPETSRVKEMRERVQEMSTGDEDPDVSNVATKGNSSDIALEEDDVAAVVDDEKPAPPVAPASSGISSRTSSPPSVSVQEDIADMPASAAEAENDPTFHESHDAQLDDHIVVSRPEGSSTPPAQTLPSEDTDTGMRENDSTENGRPALQRLTKPAVAALGRAASFVPPPSPASSVRAETGSNAGDSDYLTTPFGAGEHTPSRPGASRMSSVTSMRSVYNSHSAGPSSAGSSSLHLHLQSSLPKSAANLDTSDALSDISTEANPPGTPRPAGGESIDAPPTPLMTAAGAAPIEEKGTDPPLSTPTGSPKGGSSSASALSGAGAAQNTVQANFGRPSSSFTPSSAGASTSSAKLFINPFSSFGAGAASPFAASTSLSTFGAAKAGNASGVSSNLSTAKPFGPTAGFGSSAASPFASASSGKSAFDAAPSAGTPRDAGAGDEQEERSLEREESQEKSDKIFSSQSEVHMLTGEEDEYTQCMVPRAKLYVLDGTEWKERGVGQLRLNSKADPLSDKLSVRLVMRADAVHRLILNISLFPGMSVALAQDKFVRFSAFEEGKLRHFTARIQNQAQSKELYDNMQDMIQMLAAAGSQPADDQV